MTGSASNPESRDSGFAPAELGFTRLRQYQSPSRQQPTWMALPGMTAPNGIRIMAAYGLYTHIASNKFRSVLLLAGLFVLIYVMVYAGALIAEVVINSGASVDYYLAAAARDLVVAFPYATGIAAL